MHSHPARHKTLPQKQKCIWGRRIWQKKLQKEKIHAKIQAVGRTKQALDNFCGLLYCACGRSCVPKTCAETFFLSDGI